jgi:hypothetical protein
LIQSEWESYFHDGPRVDGLKTFAGSCTKATFHWYGDQTSKTSRYGCLPMKQKFQSPVRQIKGDQSITLDDEEFYVLSYRDDIDRWSCSSSKERSIPHSVSAIENHIGEECHQGSSESWSGLFSDGSLDWLLGVGWGNKDK